MRWLWLLVVAACSSTMVVFDDEEAVSGQKGDGGDAGDAGDAMEQSHLTLMEACVELCDTADLECDWLPSDCMDYCLGLYDTTCGHEWQDLAICIVEAHPQESMCGPPTPACPDETYAYSHCN